MVAIYSLYSLPECADFLLYFTPFLFQRRDNIGPDGPERLVCLCYRTLYPKMAFALRSFERTEYRKRIQPIDHYLRQGCPDYTDSPQIAALVQGKSAWWA